MSDCKSLPPSTSLSAHTHVFLTADFEKVRQAQAERNKGSETSSQRTNGSTKASLTENFDTQLYGSESGDKFAGYNTSIAVSEDDEEMGDAVNGDGRLVGQYTATSAQMNEWAATEEGDMIEDREKKAQIANRESDYQKKRFSARQPLTPTRADPFKENAQAGLDGQSYREVMQQRDLDREEERIKKLIADKEADGADGMQGIEYKPTLESQDSSDKENQVDSTAPAGRPRKRRWDVSAEKPATNGDTNGATNGETAVKRSRWDSSPTVGGEVAPISKSS